MPIYEYRCPKCGDFELTQRITDHPLGRCPTCGKKIKKLISNTSFQLKGTGWYLTDYARKGKGADGDGAPKPSGSDGKGESKPATSTGPGDKKATSQKGSESSAS